MNQTFLPLLLKSSRQSQPCAIINMGSVAAHMPLAFMSSYVASKAALYAYAEVLRVEIAPLGIRVINLQLGNVRTNEFNGVIEDTQLDESSLWYPVRDVYNKELGKAATNGWTPVQMARKIRDEIVTRRWNSRKGRDTVWIGEGAFFCRIITALESWVSLRIWAWMVGVMYGMGRITRREKQ